MKTDLVIRFGLAATVWFAGYTTLPAATNWVYNTNNFGPGSLHAAITNATASAGMDYIYFNITNSGPGPFTIRPTSQLPQLVGPAVIDGYTQSNSMPNTLTNGNNAVLMIELDGSSAPGVNTDGLQYANDVTIRGLVINRFKRHGLHHVDVPSTAGKIQGCFIGADISGTVPAGNGGIGIFIEAFSSIIGGTNAGDRNVISGNGGNGIETEDSGHVIQGNYIGTDKYGTNAMGNSGRGISIGSSTSVLGNTIGSTNNPAAGRNVISDNGGAGIEILGAIRTSIVGNYIGTDANNNSYPAFANNGPGVIISGGNSNLIGGTIVGNGNLIAGNGSNGVVVVGEVEVGFFTNGFANAILGNSIYGNGSLGIDLQLIATAGGVSTNDACDADYEGGNRYQNFPALSSATSTSSNITIVGSLDSAPNTNYLLEFFANSQCDPSGFGEGETFIGRTNHTAGANCTNNFLFTFPVAVAGGKFITATASRILVTNAVYETSEFSRCITNVGPATPSAVTIISTVVQGNNLCLTWTAPGGTTNFVQAAPTLTSAFTNISPPIVLAPSQTVTNYCDAGTLTNRSARLYRILVQN